MASPNGTTTEITPETPATLEAVSSGTTYEERASAAYKALTEGHSPREVNQAYNRDDAGDGEEVEEKPAEATTKPPAKDADQKPKDKADKAKPAGTKDDAAKAEELLIARRVLMRDGWEADELDLLDDDRIIAKAEKRSEHHRNLDRRLTPPAGKDDDKAGDEPGSERNAATEAEDDLVESLREYDEELAEKVNARQSTLAKENADLKKQVALQRLQAIVAENKLKYPELGDEDVLDTVLDKARALARSDAYSSADEAFTDACSLILSPRREQSAQQRLAKQNREHRQGQIDTDTVIDDGGNKPMTRDEKDSYGFMLLSKGKTAKEVAELLARIPDA